MKYLLISLSVALATFITFTVKADTFTLTGPIYIDAPGGEFIGVGDVDAVRTDGGTIVWTKGDGGAGMTLTLDDFTISSITDTPIGRLISTVAGHVDLYKTPVGSPGDTSDKLLGMSGALLAVDELWASEEAAAGRSLLDITDGRLKGVFDTDSFFSTHDAVLNIVGDEFVGDLASFHGVFEFELDSVLPTIGTFPEVTVIPLPGAMSMMVMALLGLGFVGVRNSL